MAEETETRRRRRRPRRRSGGKGGGGNRANGQGDAGASQDSQSRGERADGGAADAQQRDGRPRDQQADKQRSDGQRRDGRRSDGRRGPHRGKKARGRGRTSRGRSRMRRERIAENWWARRWTSVLEGFDVGRRLGRGRSYARQGQVVDLELGKGFVTAKVQGSRDAPYLVRMRLSMLSSTDWKKVTRRIAEDPDLVASLVRGEIPENIEEVFEPLGLSLFPTTSGDLKTACSCPDQANPCKHVAAVYYLLGEEFDRDPFLVFRLRGIDRHEIVEAIGGSAALRGPLIPAPERVEAPEPPAAEAGSDEQEDDAREERDRDEPSPPEERPPEPLPTEAHAFWAGEGVRENGGAEARIPQIPGALIRRLGGLPFFRGHEDSDAVIQRIYRNASVSGLDVYLSESD
jgi:uncharacterized Zn finger protein